MRPRRPGANITNGIDEMEKKILLTDCPDAKGLIAKITNICYKHQLNINKNDEFVDHENGRFFMRTELEGRFNDETLLATSMMPLPAGAQRRLVKAGKKRIVILVTKETHCLGDILMKTMPAPWTWTSSRSSATTTPSPS